MIMGIGEQQWLSFKNLLIMIYEKSSKINGFNTPIKIEKMQAVSGMCKKR